MSDFTPIAEWENHEALLCAWPHRESGWQDQDLDSLKEEILNFFKVVFEKSSVHLYLIMKTEEEKQSLLSRMTRDEHSRIHCFIRDYKDVWYRDIGPINVRTRTGQAHLLKPTFNAWGSKYHDRLDAHVGGSVFKDCYSLPEIFEGGALESNGDIILANKSCFDKARGYHDLEQARNILSSVFFSPVLLLDLPTLQGDDTDGHIDTMMRFINKSTLVIDERVIASPHWGEIKKTIAAFRYLVLPTPQLGSLPATYANFLFLGPNTLIVPTYGLSTCQRACQILEEALPGVTVVGVPANALVNQYGSWHCYALNIYQKEFFHD